MVQLACPSEVCAIGNGQSWHWSGVKQRSYCTTCGNLVEHRRIEAGKASGYMLLYSRGDNSFGLIVETRVYMTIITTSITLVTPANLEGDEAIPLEYLRNQIVCIIFDHGLSILLVFCFVVKYLYAGFRWDDIYYSSPPHNPGERSVKNRWWPRAPGLQCT